MKIPKKCNCIRLMKAIDAYIQKVDDDLKNALVDAGYADPKKTMKEIDEMSKELKKLLDADTKAIINEIYDYESVEDFIVSRWPDLKNSKNLVEKLTATVSLRLQEAIPEFVEEYISRTDPALKYIGLSHKTTAWIQSWSRDLADLMKLTDNKAIERILSQAVKEGLSVAQTADKIAGSGIRDSGFRSRRTATTELLRAHSVAQQESFMQSPAVVSKMWRHSGWRQYARENHESMDGQTVRKEEPFTLFGEDGGVYYPMYPRDDSLPAGESINCGCVAEPIVDESLYELSEEDRQRMQQAELNRMNDEYEWKQRQLGMGHEGFHSGSEKTKPTVNSFSTAKWRDKLDDLSESSIKSKLREYEKEIADSKIENAIVVTKDGNVWHVEGDKNSVYPEAALGERFNGSWMTHNHPVGSKNEHSFSKSDTGQFMDHNLAGMRGIDEKYIYEINRNPLDRDEHVPIVDLNGEEDARHDQMISWAEKWGVGYRRWTR